MNVYVEKLKEGGISTWMYGIRGWKKKNKRGKMKERRENKRRKNFWRISAFPRWRLFSRCLPSIRPCSAAGPFRIYAVHIEGTYLTGLVWYIALPHQFISIIIQMVFFAGTDRTSICTSSQPLSADCPLEGNLDRMPWLQMTWVD